MKNLICKQLSLLTLVITLNIFSCTSDKPSVTPNNTSNLTCDTTFAFGTRINTILQSQCYGCHGERDINFPMQPFSVLQSRVLASNSLFLKSIKHESGASPMPKGRAKLSNCDIAAIEKWVKAGALNN